MAWMVEIAGLAGSSMAVRSTDLMNRLTVEILNEVANVATAVSVGRSGKYVHIAFGIRMKGSDGGATIETWTEVRAIRDGRCGH